MAVKGIGSNYLYPVQNVYMADSKAENTQKTASQTVVQKEGGKLRKNNPRFCISRT